MRKYILLLILGGMMFCVTGCWGGGGGGDDPQPTPATTPTPTATSTTSQTVNVGRAGNYPVNLSYQVSVGSKSRMDFVITSVNVQSNGKLIFNCSWTARITAPDTQLIKESDQDKTTIYLKDDRNVKYKHNGGSGIAYTKATFTNGSTQTGTFSFPALGSTVSSITFCDDDNRVKTGSLKITH